jgi:hypothetical protein
MDLPGLPLRTVADVPLPGPSSRFDYQSLDPTANLLYVAHLAAGRLVVFDVRRRRVVTTIAAPGVHGVLAVPQIGRVFASATSIRQVITIDSRTHAVVARAPAGAYPDAIAWDPVGRHAFVSDETGGVETVIDADGHRIGVIALGGEAGNVQYDADSRRILVDVQTRNELAVIDPRANRVVRRVSLPGCAHDHGLIVDPVGRLAFIACDGNAALLTLDLARMKVVGTDSVADGPDVLAFDSSSRRLYVASESGGVTVFAERARRLTKLGQAFLAPEAHTVAVDPRTHLVYFALQAGTSGRPVLRIMAATSRAEAAPPGNADPGPVFAGTVLRAGPWRPAGAAVSPSPGARLFLRQSVDAPAALAFTLTATPEQRVDLFWSVSCDGRDNDVYLNQQYQATVQTPAIGYPPVLAGAFVCFVTVKAQPTAGGRVEATILGY